MPITTATLTSSGTTTDASSFATASVSPTANQVVLVAISNTKTSGVAVPSTVTGNGITYAKGAELVVGSRAISIWWGVSSSPSAGAITFDFAAQTQTTCFWDVEQLTGASTSNPIVQSRTGSGTNTTASLTSALATFADAVNNMGFYVVNHAATEATTFATSWNEIQDLSLSSPAVAQETAYISGGSALNPQPSWTTSSAYGIVAVEIGVPSANSSVIAMVI